MKNTDTSNNLPSFKPASPQPGGRGMPKMISPAPGGGKVTKVGGKGPSQGGTR